MSRWDSLFEGSGEERRESSVGALGASSGRVRTPQQVRLVYIVRKRDYKSWTTLYFKWEYYHPASPTVVQ
jgi:hypothetical protein